MPPGADQAPGVLLVLSCLLVVGQRLAAGLAGRAVLQRPVGEGLLFYRVAADRALLPGPAVHAQALLLLALEVLGRQALRAFYRVAERRQDRLVQRRGLGVGDARGELVRRHLRDVEHLVGVGVPDAGEHALVAQDALDLRTAAAEYLRLVLDAEPNRERVGPERLDARDVLRVTYGIHRQPLLRAGLGEVEAAVALQMHAQGERPLAGPRRRRRQLVLPAQPARTGQVDDQVQAVHVEIEELSVPGDVGDRQPAERGDRRVVGLQARDRDDVDAGDGPAHGVLTQERGERLNFR